jgi:hypothetical protein
MGLQPSKAACLGAGSTRSALYVCRHRERRCFSVRAECQKCVCHHKVSLKFVIIECAKSALSAERGMAGWLAGWLAVVCWQLLLGCRPTEGNWQVLSACRCL